MKLIKTITILCDQQHVEKGDVKGHLFRSTVIVLWDKKFHPQEKTACLVLESNTVFDFQRN